MKCENVIILVNNDAIQYEKTARDDEALFLIAHMKKNVGLINNRILYLLNIFLLLLLLTTAFFVVLEKKYFLISIDL